MTIPYKTCPICGQRCVMHFKTCQRCGYDYPPHTNHLVTLNPHVTIVLLALLLIACTIIPFAYTSAVKQKPAPFSLPPASASFSSDPFPTFQQIGGTWQNESGPLESTYTFAIDGTGSYTDQNGMHPFKWHASGNTMLIEEQSRTRQMMWSATDDRQILTLSTNLADATRYRRTN